MELNSVDDAAKELNSVDGNGTKQPKKKSTGKKSAGEIDEVEPAASSPNVTAAKRPKKKSTGQKSAGEIYTIDKILSTWNDESEYGKSFRGMTSDEQELEVVRMNRGAAKGLKTVIKSKLLDVNFKLMITSKMKEYLHASRTPMDKIFHVAPNHLNAVLSNPNFISVGEWVEVDADRTPGFNSEGGIAVITAVHDALVDVK
jgi:hypothetical protein